MIVDRLGIVIQRDPYTSKPFVEFYTRKRVGGDVINFEAIKLGVVST
jgi:HK97 family phage major capsid protein